MTKKLELQNTKSLYPITKFFLNDPTTKFEDWIVSWSV